MSKTKPAQPPPQPAETDLPEGWASATIGDVTVSKVDQSGPGDGGEFTYIDIAGIDNNEKSITAPRVVPTVDAPSRARQVVSSGDVLVSMTRPNLNAVALVGPDLNGAIASTGFDVLRAVEVTPGWLFLIVRGQAFVDSMTALVQGALYPAVRPRDVRSFQMPLPPLAEQKRIAARVEQLLGHVNAARQRLTKAGPILKRFRQSVLAAACSGQLTADWRGETECSEDLPAKWQWVTLVDLLPAGGIFDGPFGSNLKTSDYTDSGVRVIRLENIGKLRFIEEKKAYISEAKYTTLTKHTVSENDIIFASFISDEVRACVLPRLATKAIAKADCFCLRPKEDAVDRRYLALQLVSQESHDAFIGDVHGATRPRINLTQLKQLQVRLCPLSEQREIVRRVEALFTLADRIEARVQAATVRAEKLTQAILARAFRGELVPTEAELAADEGREYEPASVLLARIQEDRKQRKPARRRRGGKAMTARSAARRPAKARRPLTDVLVELKKRLTPEKLFELAGFDEGSVDQFYEQLREMVQQGKIRQVRPNEKDVYLEVTGK